MEALNLNENDNNLDYNNNVQNAEEYHDDDDNNNDDVDDENKKDIYLYENEDGVRVKSELELNVEIGLTFIGLTFNANMNDKLTNLDNQLPKPKGQLLPPTSYRNLVRLIAENAKLNVKKYENDHYYVEGDLGNLNLKDLRKNTLYPDILSLKSKDDPQVGKFQFYKYDKDKMKDSDFPDNKMYDKKLKFHMNSIKVVYFNPFLSECIHYIMHSMVYTILKPEPDDIDMVQQTMESPKPNDYHESIQELKDQMKSHFRLEISTSNPVVIVPRHFESPQYFELDLGGVEINNKCEIDNDSNDLLDIITIKTSKFKLGSHNHNIAKNVGATIQIKRKVNQFCVEPDNTFIINVPEYNATMRHSQYTLILKLLSDNLTFDPLLSPIPYTVDHIKQYDQFEKLKLKKIQENQENIEEKPGSSLFKLKIDNASLTLIHDLQKDSNTNIELAKLQLTDIIMSNVATRSNENTFSIKISSAIITDLRNLPNHVFNKILCRVQDIAISDNNNKLPSIEFIWNTKQDIKNKYKTENIDVSIVDSCSFGIGSTVRHLYDWFTTTDDPFIDKYPPPIKPTQNEKKQNEQKQNEEKQQEVKVEDEWDTEFNVNVKLKNSRIILLRDLTKSDCDALVTQGNTTVTLKSVTNFTERFSKSDIDVKLNDFKLHFAKGDQLGFDKGDKVQVLEPSDFHFINTNYNNFETKEELHENKVSLKKITIVGVTTQRAIALKEIVSDFVYNFNENAYIDHNNDNDTESNKKLVNATAAITDDDVYNAEEDIELDIDRKFDRDDQETFESVENGEEADEIEAYNKRSQLDSIDESEVSLKYKSELIVKFGRLDVFMHDETVNDGKDKSFPKIFSFGFHNFDLSAASASPKTYLEHMTINMLWHANKHYNDNWSPLVCPWNCQIKMRQSDNPATSVVIEGKEPLDVFISDIVIRGFVKNAQKWINAFKIDTTVPNVADVQSKLYQIQQSQKQSQIQKQPQQQPAKIVTTSVSVDGKSKKVFTKYRFKFIVPKFSMYIEQPIENRTLCKIVSSEYSVIYVGDQDKDTVEIKMKYFAIHDFVQESGKNFKMLIESQHSKRAKHTEFLYIYFEHWKLPRIKKAKDKLQLYLDTLKINYNPDTILSLINFAQSITKKSKNEEQNDFKKEKEEEQKLEIKQEMKDDDINQKNKKNKRREKNSSLTLRLSFDFRQLFINFNKPHLNRQIVEFGLSKTHITFKLYRDFSCDLHGRIGNLTANDLTFEGGYAAKMFNNLDCTILGLRDKNSKTLLDFKYSTNLIDSDGIKHRYRQELKVTLSSVKFKYYQLLVMEIIDYINAAILGLIYDDQPQSQSQSQSQRQPQQKSIELSVLKKDKK